MKKSRSPAPKKCIQTSCGNTCIPTTKTCRINEPKTKANVKSKTKKLVNNLKNETWFKKEKGKNRIKEGVNQAKKQFKKLDDAVWVNSKIVKRKLSEGIKAVVKKLINAIKKVARIPKVIKEEGITGIKNRSWLATARAKSGLNKTKENLSNSVKKLGGRVSNNLWYVQNAKRYKIA